MTSRISRRDFLRLSAYGFGATFLAACGGTDEKVQNLLTPTSNIPGTRQPTEASTIQPPIEPTPLKPGQGGLDTALSSPTPETKAEMDALDSWVAYWGATVPAQALPEAVGSDTSALYYKFMRDIGLNDGTGAVVLESKPGDPNWDGKIGMQPFDYWYHDRRGCPPLQSGLPVADGMDPLKMSTIVRPDSEPANAGIPLDSTLALFYKNWVTVDSNGMVNGYVDIHGIWQKVDKIIGEVPKTTESAPAVSHEVSNPFTDPRFYKGDVAFHNAVVRQQMASYSGPKLTADGTVSADADTAVFWPGAKINPISSTYFVNIKNGVVQNVVTLNLPATDKTGSDFVLNVTLNPENPERLDQPVSRATPNEILSLVPGTVEGRLSLFYCASKPTASILGDIYRNNFQDLMFGVTGTADDLMGKWIVKGGTITPEDQLKTLVTMDWFAGQ